MCYRYNPFGGVTTDGGNGFLEIPNNTTACAHLGGIACSDVPGLELFRLLYLIAFVIYECKNSLKNWIKIIKIRFQYYEDRCLGVTDTDNGATDWYGLSCADVYNSLPEACGELDDDDFTANTMCCACQTSDKCILSYILRYT